MHESLAVADAIHSGRHTVVQRVGDAGLRQAEGPWSRGGSVFMRRTLARRPQEIGARTRLEPHRWWQVEGVGPGLRPERVLAMQIGAPALMAPAQRASLYGRMLERIEAIPGVERGRLHQRRLHQQQSRTDAHHRTRRRGRVPASAVPQRRDQHRAVPGARHASGRRTPLCSS